MDSDGKWIGMRLKQLREQAGLTQGQLSKYSHVSRSYISRLEDGHYKDPSYPKLRRLARVLRVSVDEMAGELDEAGEDLDDLAMTLEIAFRALQRARQRLLPDGGA